MRAQLLAGLISALTICSCSDTQLTPVAPAPTRDVQLPDGGTLSVPVKAIRILPMSSSAVDFVFALAPRDRVIAIPAEAAIYSPSQLSQAPWPDDRTVREFSAEAMLAVNPDLVIANRWQAPAEALDMVEASGIPVLRLGNIESIEDVYEMVQLIASAVGEPRAGADLVHSLKQRAAALQASAGERSKLRVLSYTNFGSGGMSAGTSTTADVVIALAGMSNAGADDSRTGHYDIDIERLLDLDPDVFMVSQVSPEYSASRSYLDGEKALESLSAMQRNWVVEMPTSLFSTNSHHLIDTAELLADKVDALLEAQR